MNCPNCGASDEAYSHRVKHTDETEKGNTRRRRKCWNCGKTFKTIEYYVPEAVIRRKQAH